MDQLSYPSRSLRKMARRGKNNAKDIKHKNYSNGARSFGLMSCPLNCFQLQTEFTSEEQHPKLMILILATKHETQRWIHHDINSYIMVFCHPRHYSTWSYPWQRLQNILSSKSTLWCKICCLMLILFSKIINPYSRSSHFPWTKRLITFWAHDVAHLPCPPQLPDFNIIGEFRSVLERNVRSHYLLPWLIKELAHIIGGIMVHVSS